MSAPGFAAVVLAAGYGSRLAPLTQEIPKPLVPLAGRPLLGRILEKLHQLGATELAVNTHHLHAEISKYIKTLDLRVQVSYEDKILGTAGGLRKAARALHAECVVAINGDIWGDYPVEQLLRSAHAGLTLAVVPRADRAGTVGIGKRGEVVRLRGVVCGEEVRSGDYMGVAHLGAQCVSTLPLTGCLIGDWALPQLRGGALVRVVESSSDFVDVGSPAAYLGANLQLLDPSQDTWSPAPGVIVKDSWVGQGVHFEGAGMIEACVLLPGAKVTAPLRRAIVTPLGHVMPC